MPGPYPEETFDPFEEFSNASTEELDAFNTRRRPPKGEFNEGDIISVCPWSSITSDLHHARGEIVELYYGHDDDGVIRLEDTRVMFYSSLNEGNEMYQRFYGLSNGVMLFPHEIEHSERREPAWEV